MPASEVPREAETEGRAEAALFRSRRCLRSQISYIISSSGYTDDICYMHASRCTRCAHMPPSRHCAPSATYQKHFRKSNPNLHGARGSFSYSTTTTPTHQ